MVLVLVPVVVLPGIVNRMKSMSGRLDIWLSPVRVVVGDYIASLLVCLMFSPIRGTGEERPVQPTSTFHRYFSCTQKLLISTSLNPR